MTSRQASYLSVLAFWVLSQLSFGGVNLPGPVCEVTDETILGSIVEIASQRHPGVNFHLTRHFGCSDSIVESVIDCASQPAG